MEVEGEQRFSEIVGSQGKQWKMMPEGAYPVETVSESSFDDMQREELKAHLKSTETEVRRMTERMTERMEAHDKTFDARMEKMEERSQRLEGALDERLGVVDEKVNVAEKNVEAARRENVWGSTYVKTAITLIGLLLTVLTIIMGFILFSVRTIVGG